MRLIPTPEIINALVYYHCNIQTNTRQFISSFGISKYVMGISWDYMIATGDAFRTNVHMEDSLMALYFLKNYLPEAHSAKFFDISEKYSGRNTKEPWY